MNAIQLTLGGLFSAAERRDRQANQAEGERRKDAGMALAAADKHDRIAAGQLAFLDALLRSPDGTATIDDSTANLGAQFFDGGKWRGQVTRSLAFSKIIAPEGVVKSCRPARHAGYVTRWRLIDRDAAIALANRLRAAMAQE